MYISTNCDDCGLCTSTKCVMIVVYVMPLQCNYLVIVVCIFPHTLSGVGALTCTSVIVGVSAGMDWNGLKIYMCFE